MAAKRSSLTFKKLTPTIRSTFLPLASPKANLDLVTEAVAAVVTTPQGTAHSARIMDEKYAMGGKTGTAQVRRITMAERAEGVMTNDELPWEQRDHALFFGFAPVSAPRYVVSVVVEHGGSGAHIAAPIARDILLEAKKTSWLVDRTAIKQIRWICAPCIDHVLRHILGHTIISNQSKTQFPWMNNLFIWASASGQQKNRNKVCFINADCTAQSRQ